jgi:hypothetical protein
MMMTHRNLLYSVGTLAVCWGFFSCGDSSSRMEATAPASSAISTPVPVVQDTIRIVYQETLRTVIYDTLRTVVLDTHSTVVTDTVRVVLMEVEEPEATPSVLPLMSKQEMAVVRDQLEQGRLPHDALAALMRDLPELYNVKASRVDSGQLQLIAGLTGVRIDSISHVRWGRSNAPPDHPMAGGAFVTVRTPSMVKVVQLDSVGTIAPAQ